MVVVCVSLKSSPDAGVGNGERRVRRGISASGGPVVVQDVGVGLLERGQSRGTMVKVGAAGLVWEGPGKKIAGRGVSHFVPREGCVARCPHDAG